MPYFAFELSVEKKSIQYISSLSPIHPELEAGDHSRRKFLAGVFFFLCSQLVASSGDSRMCALVAFIFLMISSAAVVVVVSISSVSAAVGGGSVGGGSVGGCGGETTNVTSFLCDCERMETTSPERKQLCLLCATELGGELDRTGELEGRALLRKQLFTFLCRSLRIEEEFWNSNVGKLLPPEKEPECVKGVPFCGGCRQVMATMREMFLTLERIAGLIKTKYCGADARYMDKMWRYKELGEQVADGTREWMRRIERQAHQDGDQGGKAEVEGEEPGVEAGGEGGDDDDDSAAQMPEKEEKKEKESTSRPEVVERQVVVPEEEEEDNMQENEMRNRAVYNWIQEHDGIQEDPEEDIFLADETEEDDDDQSSVGLGSPCDSCDSTSGGSPTHSNSEDDSSSSELYTSSDEDDWRQYESEKGEEDDDDDDAEEEEEDNHDDEPSSSAATSRPSSTLDHYDGGYFQMDPSMSSASSDSESGHTYRIEIDRLVNQLLVDYDNRFIMDEPGGGDSRNGTVSSSNTVMMGMGQDSLSPGGGGGGGGCFSGVRQNNARQRGRGRRQSPERGKQGRQGATAPDSSTTDPGGEEGPPRRAPCKRRLPPPEPKTPSKKKKGGGGGGGRDGEGSPFHQSG